MTTETPHNGSTRLEREILEILERTDTNATPVDELQAAVRRQRASASRRVRQAPRPQISPEILKIGGALLLAVATAVVADVSRVIAIMFAIASLVVFLSLWAPSRAPGIGGAPRWRGQDLSEPRGSPVIDLDRLRSWWGPRRPNK